MNLNTSHSFKYFFGLPLGWATVERAKDDTCNGPEPGRHFKGQFYYPHPSIYNLYWAIWGTLSRSLLKTKQSNRRKKTNHSSKVISNIKTETIKQMSRLDY